MISNCWSDQSFSWLLALLDSPHKSSKKNSISTKDYYNKAAEFRYDIHFFGTTSIIMSSSAVNRMWLLEKHNIFFEDIDTDTAKSYFKKFVEKWNSGSLPSKLSQYSMLLHSTICWFVEWIVYVVLTFTECDNRQIFWWSCSRIAGCSYTY